MTRQPWTYRGIEVRPVGRTWSSDLGEAKTKNEMCKRIDAHHAVYERVADDELIAARMEREWPWGGFWR